MKFHALKRIRKSFGKVGAKASMPNLIEVQKTSYEDNFLQLNSEEKEKRGLEAVLSSFFPIHEPSGTATLQYVKYGFEYPKYEVDECKERDLSYAAALKVTLRLIVWDIDKDTGTKEIKGIKEQEVYMGDIPLMTQNGTFIINGTERVVVSQIHRSPGVFFDHDKGKSSASGKFLYLARLIPHRGAWLEFELAEILYFRIDKKRKLYATTLLKALGMSSKEILDYYYRYKSFKKINENTWSTEFNANKIVSQKLEYNLITP